MAVSQFIAMRYMKASRENRFFSWIAILSIAGISIGVAAMIVVLSVINGFEMELRQRFLAANAHVLAYRFPAGMESPEKWADIFMKDFGSDIQGVSQFIHYETMARKGALMQAIMVRGIIPTLRAKVQNLESITDPPAALNELQQEMDRVKGGEKVPEVPSVIAGRGLLKLLDAQIGETIQLVSPDPDSLGEMRPFKVVGAYDSGLKHYDNRIVIMSLATAQSFFKMGNKVTGLEIGLKNPRGSAKVAAAMQDKYNLTIKEWQSFSRNLFEAMQMERAVIALLVFLVGGVAAFNILTTLFVSVTQKQVDISILKALGASRGQILSLFVTQGLIMGIIGSLIGSVLAFGISHFLEWLSQRHVIDLPDLYLLARLPVSYDWLVYVAVSGFGMLICVVAGLYPAFVATRVPPSAGFRGIADVAG